MLKASLPSVWLVLILFIILVLMILICYLFSISDLFDTVAIIITIVIIFSASIILPYQYNKEITCEEITETKAVSQLPNQVMNSESYIFIVENRQLRTDIDKETLYINDGDKKPRIVVVKKTYTAKRKWYISESSTEGNNKVTYLLKELHY